MLRQKVSRISWLLLRRSDWKIVCHECIIVIVICSMRKAQPKKLWNRNWFAFAVVAFTDNKCSGRKANNDDSDRTCRASAYIRILGVETKMPQIYINISCENFPYS